MKAIILAAGYATRLYPMTENFPKPLLEVGGKPILDWLIEDIKSAIDEFIVVTNHKFYDHFKQWSERKAEKIAIVDDGTLTNETRLGAVRDLQLALKKMENLDECFVMAGDNLLSFSLLPFLDFYREKQTSCVMCHREDAIEKLQKTAVITVDAMQKITSYEEKPQSPKSNLAVPPFYIYTSEDLGRVGEALESGCNPDAPGSFAAWLSDKTSMHAWVMSGQRYDIGDMKSYEEVKQKWQ